LKVLTGRPDDPSVGARIFLPGQESEAASALAATEALEHLPSTISKDSIGSTITVIPAEERLFNPDVFPAPHRPVRSRSRLAMVGSLVGFILAIALTAFIAIGQLPLADIWRRLTVERAIELASSWARPAPTPPMRAELATPRLIVHRRVVPGEPAALGLAVQGGAESAVIIRGLLPGMELSNGDAVAADASQVAATALGKTWIAPPESFIGSADLVAELRLPDNKIADRLAIQLEWGPPISPEPTRGPSDWEEPGLPISPTSAPPHLDRQQIVAGPPISPEPTQGPSDREEPGSPSRRSPRRANSMGRRSRSFSSAGKTSLPLVISPRHALCCNELPTRTTSRQHLRWLRPTTLTCCESSRSTVVRQMLGWRALGTKKPGSLARQQRCDGSKC
jgi:hypothetical protein